VHGYGYRETMTRTLLTGFDPFAGDTTNPSWEAVRLAVAEPVGGLELHSALLPCRFADVIDVLWEHVERIDPDVVICTGLAGGRMAICIERIAVNVDDAWFEDNAGAAPVDEPIVPGGPAAYFSTLPVKACVAAVRSIGIPAVVSQTAGTFVCNHVFYGLSHRAATLRPGRLRTGFVHVPYAPEQVPDGSAPTMAVAITAAALLAVAATVSQSTVDTRLPAGTVS
jgi:pyroglutamyl-peptidase